LTEDEKSYGHFMQEIATAHTANNSMNALAEAFGVKGSLYVVIIVNKKNIKIFYVKCIWLYCK
jgi:hypothetical protein